MPWPTQGLTSLGDITDTKTSFLVVWWAVLLLSNLGTWMKAIKRQGDPIVERRFGWWTIVALLVTVFVFLIPHSQFLQTSH
jgi:hypothetical protein